MPEDRHLKTKSKYTADRQYPGAFEGETVTRRRFMTGTAHVAGAVALYVFSTHGELSINLLAGNRVGPWEGDYGMGAKASEMAATGGVSPVGRAVIFSPSTNAPTVYL